MGARLLAVLEDIDIAQETLAVAMRKIADFEPRSHARIIDWLAQIAENQMRDAHRKYLSSEKRNPERAVPLDAHAESGAHSRAGLQISNGEPGPATVAARKELAEVLDECLELLPSRYRELILLREYAHADRDEIAAQARRPNAHAAEVAY